MRHRCFVVTLGVMLVVALAACRGPERSPKPRLELVDVHRRQTWKTEIPVDLDMNGDDEILLVTDGRRSTAECTQFQLKSIVDNFIRGPHIPPGQIQDLKALDLDGDGKAKELVLCLKDPCSFEVVSQELSLLARHPLAGCDTADVRVQAAFDADGTKPLEILLSVTEGTEPARSRLIALDWTSGKRLWEVNLPGALECSVLHLTTHEGPRLVAGFAAEDGTGFWVIGADGGVIHKQKLTDTSARACLLAIEYPQREPKLATVTAGGAPYDAILTSWHALGAAADQQTLVPHATLPALTCHHKNACGIAVGTLRGEIVILDPDLRPVVSHKVADGPVRLVTTADLDLNGSSDIICRTDDGKAVCLCLPSGNVASCEARDGVQVVREGFGIRPLLVPRNGEHYLYFELKCPTDGLSGIPVNAGRAALGTIMLGAIGLIVGYSASATRLHRRVRRLLDRSALPAGITTADGRLLWTNKSLDSLLGGSVPLKPRRSLREHLRAAGLTHPRHTAGETDREIPTSLTRGNRCFTCGPEPLRRDALGRRRVLVHVEEDPGGRAAATPGPWAVAAREITAQMRNSLSTVGLTAQWLLTHRRTEDDAATSTIRAKLERVHAEARSLRALAAALARAAAVEEDEPTVLDPATIVTESLRELTSETGRHVEVRVAHPTAPFTGSKRQLVLALQTICEALLRAARKGDDIWIGASSHRGEDSVSFEIGLKRELKPPDDGELALPSYAAALAAAVARTHGGSIKTNLDDPKSIILRILLPRKEVQ